MSDLNVIFPLSMNSGDIYPLHVNISVVNNSRENEIKTKN